MLLNRLSTIALRLAVLALAAWASPSHDSLPVAIADPVTVVTADPHHHKTLLAGTSTALLFRSRDGAGSWNRLSFPAELHATLHAILIDPARTDVYLVAVTSETPQFAGVFQSTDEGVHWEQIHDLRQKQVWSLASSPADPRVMAAGTQDGVYITDDGGDHWTHASSTGLSRPQPVVALTFDPTHRNILYAGTPHLAWKTTDAGATWRRLSRGMQEDSDIFSIAADTSWPRRLYAGACSGIYRSVDGGDTWASLERFVGAQFRTYVVTYAPVRANTLFAGTNAGLIQSTDGGHEWRRLLSLPVRSIAFDPSDPQRIFAATDQGILRSEDGGVHFMEASQGLPERPLSALVERDRFGRSLMNAMANTRTR